MKKIMKKLWECIMIMAQPTVAGVFAVTLATVVRCVLPDPISINTNLALTLCYYVCFYWVFEEKRV